MNHRCKIDLKSSELVNCRYEGPKLLLPLCIESINIQQSTRWDCDFSWSYSATAKRLGKTKNRKNYLSLVIPAFNEENRLPGALNETMNYLKKRAANDESFSYEVLIVDDGSRDKTKNVAFDFVKKYGVNNVRVILLGKNHGEGEAIRKGMLHSRGQLLLMLDADGATNVTDLEKLENQIHAVARKDHHGYSTTGEATFTISDPNSCIGSRAHLEEKALATRKWYRNFLMKGFHLVVLLAAGPGIRDTQCGFKMFTRSAARKLFTNIRLKRWCFDVELVFLCKWFGIPMLEISVNSSEIPGSKVNPLSIPNMLWEIALTSVGYRLVSGKLTPDVDPLSSGEQREAMQLILITLGLNTFFQKSSLCELVLPAIHRQSFPVVILTEVR
ncbi:dolichyl-phosphate beta-glucosyltransferase-like [Hibiscus syriacus]|uniref:dolichyl-phosphate beta-glucosyltransferase-like n=1 Tax=Hibiscus syriacus TaxID=106335 RepID=UPI001924BCED|nr:dolichyl-phosphate beta-glucosyltransferase-like [Hibiscus syriacus]